MEDYVGKKMICDIKEADGGVYFEREYFEFRPRAIEDRKYQFKIYYKDIISVQGYKGIKSTVAVQVAKGYYKFFMYKMNTFIELVEAGRKGYNIVDVDVDTTEPVNSKEPLTDAQLDKLSKLNQLHKDGVLSDEQFEEEKSLILNRK